MLALVIVEAAAILVLGILVAGLLRSHADILRSLHDLGAGIDPDGATGTPAAHTLRIGAPDLASDLSGTNLTGDAVAVGVAGTSADTLLVFLSSSCLSCRPFWAELADPSTMPSGLRTVVVAQDEDSRSALSATARGCLAEVVMSSAAWSDYGVPGSPHAVLVHGPTGRVLGEGTGRDLHQVVSLLRHADESTPSRRADRDSAGRDSAGRDSADRIDRELASAGILAGDESLYPARRDGAGGNPAE